jgi:hypothetical protein
LKVNNSTYLAISLIPGNPFRSGISGESVSSLQLYINSGVQPVRVKLPHPNHRYLCLNDMNTSPTLLFLGLCFAIRFTLGAFLHPGILQTSQDLARMRSLANSSKGPWKTAFVRFTTDTHSNISYRLRGPLPVITRDKDAKKTKGMVEFAEDSVAALQLSQMWVITQNVKYANRALDVLNAWGRGLKVVNGTVTPTIIREGH